jgi:hypothetical protein
MLPMLAYESSAVINAPPQVIWDILTNVAAYPNWDSGVVRVDGHVSPGARITVFSSISPGRAFPVTVTQLEPPRTMRWSGGMPLGLFKGERSFALAPAQDDRVRFSMREDYTGLLAPLIFKSIPDLNASFEQFANGLKQRAEHRDSL